MNNSRNMLHVAIVSTFIFSSLSFENFTSGRVEASKINSHTVIQSSSEVPRDTYYGYCVVKIGDSDELKMVVSSIFSNEGYDHSVGAQNSFYEYVNANFSDAVSRPSCNTAIDNYQDAIDRRNSYIGQLRRRDWTVYTVSWSYSAR